jgi:hypothetical protein
VIGRSVLSHVFAGLLTGLVACGGSGSGASKSLASEGYTALGKGDARGALVKFDEALAGLSASDSEYARAALGRCEALALIDGVAAARSFLELAATAPDREREDDYGLVFSRLLQAEFRVDAMDVMKAGLDRFPESKRMAAIYEQVDAATKRANQPEELKKLASFGYAGGGG